MNKKLFAVVAAAAVAGSAFADVELSFSNEVSSDIVNVTIPKDGDSSASFAGITETASVEVTSDRVDAGLEVSFSFNVNDDDALADSKGNSKWANLAGYEIDDYYIEFRPVDILTLGFHDSIFTPGSYLPVEDDNLGNGNLGSDFVLCLRPIEGLRATAGIDFVSYFGHEDFDAAKLNFGIDYTTDAFSAGAALRDVINNFGFGVFGALTAVDGLNLTAGFAYNDEFADVAGNLLSVGASYDITDSLSAALDFVTNFGDDGNDMYVGASCAFGATDALELSLAGTFKNDFDADDSSVISVEPGVTYTVGNHEFGFAVSLEFANDETALAFPISWTYSF